MKIWREIKAVTDRHIELLEMRRAGTLTPEDSDEEKSVIRRLALMRIWVGMYAVFGFMIVGLLAIGCTMIFAQTFAVPGSANERVHEGRAFEALRASIHACAPDREKVPALYVVQSAGMSFATVASGRAKLFDVWKIAATKLVSDSLSPPALQAVFAHEIGYLTQVAHTSIDADKFSARCLGKEAVLAAYSETSALLHSETFIDLLRKQDVSNGDIQNFLNDADRQMSERREVISNMSS